MWPAEVVVELLAKEMSAFSINTKNIAFVGLKTPKNTSEKQEQQCRSLEVMTWLLKVNPQTGLWAVSRENCFFSTKVQRIAAKKEVYINQAHERGPA